MAQIKAGDQAPDFETVDENGKPVKLSDFKGKKVVLYFYPKDNTTGCTAQACGFRDYYPQIEAGDAIVLGVSPDSAKSHTNFKNKFELPFPLLVDSDHKIAEAYDVWQEKSMYGRKYMGILRSHFVIGPDGKVLAAEYKVSPNDSVSKSLKVLAGA
jgi:thioredoxin-dependent peroxiredoxin